MDEKFVINYYDMYHQLVHISKPSYNYPNEKHIKHLEPKGKMYEYATIEKRFYKRR